MRRYRIGALLTGLALILGLFAATVTPAHAASVNIGAWVFTVHGSNQAQNNWNCTYGTNLNPVNFYPDPQGRNCDVWGVNNLGKVNGGAGCSPNCGPFTEGSGLNADYNGDFVVQLGFVTNSTWRNQNMDASQYSWQYDDGDNASTDSVTCQNIVNGGNNGWRNCGVAEEFIISGSDFLVSVWGSNLSYSHYHITHFPVWLGNGQGQGSGAPVNISHANAVQWTATYIEQIEIND